jgi:oligopeptide/dipeptide ABC transporter ATP-binding protein
MREAILTIDDLRLDFPSPGGDLTALRGVSLGVAEGEIFGIVGESGCGKSLTGRAVLGLVPPPGRVSGRILYRGENLAGMDAARLRALRGRRIAMVFQDPAAALNPLFTVGTQIVAVMRRHGIASGRAARRRAADLLADLGLPDPARTLERFPHELSGGMQQRVMLAIALAAEPELVVADEATTALDVTIQAQIIDLIARLRRERNLTLLFITHDLGLVAEIADRVAVLYMGRVVEEGSVSEIFRDPLHPYTRGLLDSLPNGQPFRQPLRTVRGTVPGAAAEIAGCAFAPRCDAAREACRRTAPPEVVLGGGRRVACVLHQGTGSGAAQ